MADLLLATESDSLADQIEACLADLAVVHRVWSGADVLAAINEIGPAVVLLDSQVGSMGGIATCLAVRQREQMGDIESRSILLLLDREADTFLAREASADGWLVKPLDPLAARKACKDALGILARSA